MTPAVAPVESWLRVFHHLTDAQILNPDYALHPANGGRTWCKLCDAPVEGDPAKHLDAHKRNLATYRTRQRSQALRKANSARRRAA